MWSSERLVLETALTPRLADAIPKNASRETAARTADDVRGKWATYFVIEPAPFGWVSESTALEPGFERGRRTYMATNRDIGGMLDQMSAERSKDKLKALGRSPEEQVQRARQREAAK